MQRVYFRKVETGIVPLRRIEAAIWNVQIVKAGSKQLIDPAELYPLGLDDERPAPKTRMSRDEYIALVQQSSTV